MDNAIVVGASGYIGRNLIRQLIRHGVHVFAVYRHFLPTDLQESGFVEPFQCDLDQLDRLKKVCRCGQYNVFYQLAWEGARGYLRADPGIQTMNAVYTCNALNVASALGCRKFITVGTISERLLEFDSNREQYAQNMVYAATKVFTHNLIRVLSSIKPITAIWAQLSNVYGGDDNSGNLISYTINCFNNGNTPEFGPCNNPYDFVHIKDVSAALYSIGFMKTSYTEYFIGRCEHKTLRQYIELIGQLYGKPVRIGAKEDDGLRFQEAWFDNDRLVNDLGFSFQYSFEEGIRSEMVKGE